MPRPVINPIYRMRNNSAFINTALKSTPVVLIALIAYAVLAMFAMSDSATSESTKAIGRVNRDTGKLQFGKATSINTSQAIQRTSAKSQVRALSLASDDFDEDGAPDLLTGYDTGRAGMIMLQRGNVDAFAPRDNSIFDRAAAGQLPPSLLTATGSFGIPERADMILTGDFNDDGHKDLLTAAQGGGLYLISGDGHGSFGPAQKLQMPGTVSALTAGAFSHSTGWLAVIAAIDGPQGPAIAVFDQNQQGLSATPTITPLAASATALSLGLMDEDPFFDLAVASGSQVLIIHGQRPGSSAGNSASDLRDRFEVIDVGANVLSVVTGDFLADGQMVSDIAALTASGQVALLQRTQATAKQYPIVDFDSTTQDQLRQLIRTRREEEIRESMAKPTWQPGGVERWNIVRQLDGEVGKLEERGSQSLLTKSGISSRPAEDLVLLDKSGRQVRILVGVASGLEQQSGDLQVGAHVPTALAGDTAPVAVLTMAPKFNGERDLVVLRAGQSTAQLLPLAPLTLTINTTTDSARSPIANQCNGVAGDCSLREAVLKTNSTTGPHTIIVPAGTYNLSVNNPNTPAATGTINLPDLEIGSALNTNTTLMGTGGKPVINQTINLNDVITTGFADAALNPQIVTLSLQNIEVSGGTFTGIFTGADSGSSASTTTINNANIHNNSNSDATFGQGGSIFNQCGTLTIQNSSFTANSATNSAKGQGGAIFYNLANASGQCSTGNLTIANTSFTSNTSAVTSGFPAGGAIFTSIVSAGTASAITNSTFNANQATGGGDGGALAISNTSRTQNILSSTFTNNTATNAAGRGGAISANAGTTNITFNRLINNTTTTVTNGRGIFRNGGTANADDNWWGVNTGPAANDLLGLTVTKSLQLRNTASPAAVLLGGSTTLTAGFLTDSANTPIAASNLFSLAGLPVIWNNVLKGALSNTQTSIQAVRNIAAAPTGATEAGSSVTITTTVAHGFSVGQSVTIAGVSEPGYNGTFNITSVTTNSFTYTHTTTGLGASGGGTATVPFGTATTGFTAGTNSASCGAGGATATVDSQPVAGLVTVQCPDLTAAKTNDVSNIAVVGQTWTWTQTINNGGDAVANFLNGQTILLDNLPNSVDISYTVLTPSIVLGGLNSGTVDCAINGSKDLTCTANGAVTIGVGGSFQVNISAKANVVGPYANPRGGGISRVDPNDSVVESNEGNQDSSNTVTVNKASTTTTITNGVALGTASVVGEAVVVQWNVTVNAPGSVGAALTGNVTVSDGTNNCTAAITAGQCAITFTTAGSKSITASYAGDSNYNGSTSTPATPHTVNKADTTTSITNINISPSVVGQAVTVQWNVTVNPPGSLGAALTGNVTVSDGVNNCSAAFSAGQCNITFTTAGNKSLTAQYAGDTNYNGSTSTTTAHTVNPANTTTTISNAASLASTPSVVGQAVTVTWSVTVNAPGSLGAALTGNVTVTDGTDGCTAAVSAGQCNVTFNTAGVKSLTAQYAGDSNYNGSTSASASHTVNQANTVTTITNNASLTGTPSVVGEAVLVQWSVAVSAPGTLGAPLTGTVTASDGVNSCNAPVATGQCSIIFTSPGTKTITAQYSGDTNYAGSTSAGVSHTVNQSNSLTTITSDAPDPSSVGQSVTVNFSVVAVAPGAGTPTGNVNVTVSGGAETCTGTVAVGSCALVLNGTGTRTITATYVGDTNFIGSSDTEQHDVSNLPPDVSVRDARVAEPTSGTANMLFTIVLSTPAPVGGVTVNFATASGGANPATPGTDYTPIAAGSVNFTPGQQIKAVPVTILADPDNSETDETLLLNLTGATGGNIVDNQATGTITPAGTAGTFLISELRTSGPAGPDDDFVELYNNTDSPINVAASDASAGYGLYKKGADCDATPILIATIPNGTVIPARGHYLVVGSAYSLAANAAGNQTMTSNLEADANVAIFSTADVGNISSATALDAVGFGSNTGSVCDLLREGTTLPALGVSTLEYSFERDPCGKGGNPGIFGGCPSSTPIDKNNNATDFLFADTTGANTIAGQRLGAPGPENLASPLLRNSTIPGLFLDATVPAGAAPNRVRDLTPVTNGASGTLSIRRRFVNNTGAPVTRLRFRVVDITSAPVPGGIADVRALTSGSVVVSGVNDSATCLASNGSPATPCTITVQGTTLEAPPAQPNGGAINSTMSAGTITLGTPLPAGASVNVQYLLGVQVTGTFKFYVNIEALP